MKMEREKFVYQGNSIHRITIEFNISKEFCYDSDGDSYAMFTTSNGKIVVDSEMRWR